MIEEIQLIKEFIDGCTVVQGDCYHRLCPGAGQRQNTTAAWIVSDSGRSKYKTQLWLNNLIEAISYIEENYKNFVDSATKPM